MAGFELARRLVVALASLRLTLFSLVALLLAVAYIYDRSGEADATLPLVGPLSLLALNLLAAVATNKAFHRQLPLLVFHLALLAIILLSAVGRLTYLRGTTEIVTGGEHQSIERIEAGPWHRGDRDTVKFENLGFRIEYKPGLQRDATINRVRWQDESGVARTTEIGDQVPLVIRGYRIYTSSNKGFAAMFRWEPNGSPVEAGSVNFPGYPSNKDAQMTSWKLGTEELTIKLHLPGELIDPESQSQFRLPDQHQISIELPWRVAFLNPGDNLPMPTGRLTYIGLTTWMGYNIFYDWTMPWLLMACTLAVLALAWHFWQKFSARPWQAE